MIENDRINRLNITNVVPFFFGKSYLRNSLEFSEASQGITKFKFNSNRLLKYPDLSFRFIYYNKYGIEFLELKIKISSNSAIN